MLKIPSCIRFYTYMIIGLLFLCFNFVNASDQIITKRIQINTLDVDELNNTIQVECTFEDEEWITALQNKRAILEVNIHSKDTILRHVTIKKEEQRTHKTLVLTLQLPLADAIYKAEKRTIELLFTTNTAHEQVRKDFILGSVLHVFDLRSYTFINKTSSIVTAILLVLCISIILMILTPLYQKYNFKKNHIKKYSSIRKENGSHQDTFTFVPIEDHDNVVVMNDQVLLLSSWKTLSKLSESKPAEDHSDFFPERLEGTFFKPKSNNLKKMNTIWYGIMGICTGWILYLNISEPISKSLHILLASFFDGDHLQVSSMIISDTLLGAMIGLCYSIGYCIAENIQDKESYRLAKTIKNIVMRFILIAMAFFLQSLVIAYLIPDFYSSGILTWIIISFAFVSTVTLEFHPKRQIILALGVAILVYFIHIILTTTLMMNVLGVGISFFGSLILLSVLTLFLGDKGLKKTNRGSSNELETVN